MFLSLISADDEADAAPVATTPVASTSAAIVTPITHRYFHRNDISSRFRGIYFGLKTSDR
jgi:uncharacterized membrane protein YadS